MIKIILGISKDGMKCFNFYLHSIRYFKSMSKQPAKGAPAKPAASQPKVPEKKVWKAEDYATLTIPVE